LPAHNVLIPARHGALDDAARGLLERQGLVVKLPLGVRRPDVEERRVVGVRLGVADEVGEVSVHVLDGMPRVRVRLDEVEHGAG
jgi:hypothetical protein